MIFHLIAIESGMELMVQLTVLTGIQFSSPTGIIGSYNHGKKVTFSFSQDGYFDEN